MKDESEFVLVGLFLMMCIIFLFAGYVARGTEIYNLNKLVIKSNCNIYADEQLDKVKDGKQNDHGKL